MTYNKLIDLNLLNEFLNKIKNLFATKDVATQNTNGLLSAEDKTKIDNLETTYRTITAQNEIDANKAAATSVPNTGSISNTGLISIKHDSTELFTIQLPLYQGGVSNGT